MRAVTKANPSVVRNLKCETPILEGVNPNDGKCSACSGQPKWSSSPFAQSILNQDIANARILIENGFDDFFVPYSVTCKEDECALPDMSQLKIHLADALRDLDLWDYAKMLENKIGRREKSTRGVGDVVDVYVGPFVLDF